MNNPFRPAGDLTHLRTVIRQGAVVKILAAKKRRHAGGGERGAQHGHTKRSESRLHSRLLTCLPAEQVIWLTYPQIRGPIGVEKNARAFLGRLEKHLGRKVGAVIKMEVQERLAPELAILLWTHGEARLGADMVEKLWSETIKTMGRVKVESVRDWNQLASYVSKQVIVSETEIVIGSKRLPFPTSESVASFFIKRAHNPENPDCNEHPFPNPYSVSMESMQARKEWASYTGRFHWKHQNKLIPRHDKTVMQIPEEKLVSIRRQINSKRVTHFVGRKAPMTLRGEDAIRAARFLGFHTEGYDTGVSKVFGTRRPAYLSAPAASVPGQVPFPFASRDFIPPRHGESRPGVALRIDGLGAYLQSPLELPPWDYTGGCAAFAQGKDPVIPAVASIPAALIQATELKMLEYGHRPEDQGSGKRTIGAFSSQGQTISP